MLRTRIIPALLLKDESLVKTIKFNKSQYIGDPVNTVRIFNELEVDELLFLDIGASINGVQPNYRLLNEIANECFMPLGYGGGISTIDQAKKIFDIGFEKVVLNTNVAKNPQLISRLANKFGSQAIIVSIDVKTGFLGRQTVRTMSGTKNTKLDPIVWAKQVEEYGAGEILLTSIDHEGLWQGFNYDLVAKISTCVNIPVIAHGGAGNSEHIAKVVKNHSASAVALGSMVVFQKKGMGVLINFPKINLD